MIDRNLPETVRPKQGGGAFSRTFLNLDQMLVFAHTWPQVFVKKIGLTFLQKYYVRLVIYVNKMIKMRIGI